jgi:hypothetical protein
MERFLRVNLLGPGPSSYKKIIYRAAVSQRLGNNGLDAVKRISAFTENRKLGSQVVSSVAKSHYIASTALTHPLINVYNSRQQMC